jgi:hypothetical protein
VPAGRYEAPNFPATNGGRFKEQYDLARNELSSAAERTNMDSSENGSQSVAYAVVRVISLPRIIFLQGVDWAIYPLRARKVFRRVSSDLFRTS